MIVKEKFLSASLDQAKKLAGSIRLSGIQVSEREERWMAEIITSRSDGQLVKKNLFEHLKKKSS